MSEIFKLFMTALLTSNVVYALPYGICSYLGVSKSKKNSIGMGLALTFVTLLATIICYFLNMLLEHFEIEYMSTICFILVIASVVQFVEMFVKKFSPSLYKALGIYLPLITTNCVVLYVVKQMTDMTAFYGTFGISNTLGIMGDFLFIVVFALGTSLGYFLALYLFSVIREKMDASPTPKGFKGVAIGLICSAIMAMVFINGFSGVF